LSGSDTLGGMATSAAATSMLGVLRRIAFRQGVALALFGVTILIVLPVSVPRGPWFYGSLALSVVSMFAGPAAGRLAPLPMGTHGDAARQQAIVLFRVAFFRQMFAIQLPALLAVMFAFVTENAAVYLVPVTVAEALWFSVAYPSDSRVARAERDLDAGGATSELRQALAGD
jgi:hypothetical protein